jgi:hypothetical protein
MVYSFPFGARRRFYLFVLVFERTSPIAGQCEIPGGKGQPDRRKDANGYTPENDEEFR